MDLFLGEYYLGFRHGRGQLIYPNNVLYVGEWKWDKVGKSRTEKDMIGQNDVIGHNML